MKLTKAVILSVMISAIIIAGSYAIYVNYSVDKKSPPHIFVSSTPQAYMMVSTSNQSINSGYLYITFTDVSENFPLNCLELEAVNGLHSGITRLGNSSAHYSLNVTGDSEYNVTVSGGPTFNDSTTFDMQHSCGIIENFTSIELLDYANGNTVSLAFLNSSEAQSPEITPSASMAFSPSSIARSGNGPYSLSFSGVSRSISMRYVELQVSNVSTIGSISFGNYSSEFSFDFNNGAKYQLTIYGGDVFSNFTFISLQYQSGKIENITSLKLIDLATGLTIASISTG